MYSYVQDYPLIQILEDSWEGILKEYKVISDKLVIWPEHNIHNGKWEAYGIVFKGEQLANECPYTTKIINSIPGVYIAGFSVLKAGCRIKPHTGYTQDVNRVHLGLICPKGCWISVDNEKYSWTQGKGVMFNDMLLHEAANESDVDRVILIVDIKKGN